MNIVIGIIAIVVGLGVLALGRFNLATGTASETGSRRLTNRALGNSNEYTGTMASMSGWTRIVVGAALVVFGVVFMLAG
jgi:hypothetical protein